MKKGTIIALLLISAIGLASSYGSYYSFSLGNFLDGFDPSTMILGLLFVIFLVFLKFTLSRAMKNSEGAVNVMSICISLLMIYGINRMDWDYENFLYDLGLTSDILYAAVPILLIIALFYIAKSKKEGHFLFYRIFLLLGAVATIISFTDLVYEKGLMLTIGIILLLWGLWLRHRHKRKLGGYSPSVPNSSRLRIPFSGRYSEWKNHQREIKERQRLNDLKDIDYQRAMQRQQQQAQQIQKVKIRTLNDLKQKYMAYLFAYYRKGTSPQQQMRMKQALSTILKMAAQQGCDANTFLSSRIGGSNAKAPGDLP